jgi:hypothetical protein
MCSHLLLFLLSRSKLFLSKHLFDIIMNISNNIRVWCASGGIYLWSKVVCFVLFLSWDLPSHGAPCDTHYIFETLFNVEISQATTLHVVLIVSSKHFWWQLKVHQLGLRLFGISVWKLLIIEPFSQWKLNKIKIENCVLEFEGVVEKALTLINSNLINFISQFQS